MIFKVKRSSDLFEDKESKETTEINTLEDLQKFQKDCGHSIIINFKYNSIEIYDSYRE